MKKTIHKISHKKKKQKNKKYINSLKRKRRNNCTKLAPILPLSGVENSLLALETVLPMSAKERRLDFLVWWRCFLSKVYMTLSFRSAFKRPFSIWLSVIISERNRVNSKQRQADREKAKWGLEETCLMAISLLQILRSSLHPHHNRAIFFI